ncbi:CHAP domain-containing protein, partial [Staphylococcus gallinarum]
MTITKTKKEAVAYLKSLEGKYLDYDGWYGAQCFD